VTATLDGLRRADHDKQSRACAGTGRGSPLMLGRFLPVLAGPADSSPCLLAP